MSCSPSKNTDSNLPTVQIKYVALPTPLPTLNDDNNRSTTQLTATADEGFPCRRCLLDAEPGEVVHLLSYDPFPFPAPNTNSSSPSPSPYRGKGPIFVHARPCEPFSGLVLPETQLRRLVSLRAYDERQIMVEAEVVQGGQELETVVREMLTDQKVEFVNVHNAKPGCFAVRVERV